MTSTAWERNPLRSRELCHFTLALDFFAHEWGWHFENVTYEVGFRQHRQIAVHVGPLLVTIWAPPEHV